MKTLPLTNELDAILVLTNVPDQACAERIAEYLVSQQLAACVNIQSPCLSVYRWQGSVERAVEIPLYIKSSKSRYDALEAAIREMHPYELPEIVYVNLDGGGVDYLQWLNQNIVASVSAN